MTGWRIGYTIGSVELIDRMSTIQSHQTSNATSIAQAAAIEALTGPQESIAAMTQEYQRRRNYIVGALNRIPEFIASCLKEPFMFIRTFAAPEGKYQHL